LLLRLVPSFILFFFSGFAYLSSNTKTKFTANEPLVQFFLISFVNETARKALLQRYSSNQLQSAQTHRGFLAEWFLPTFLKGWENASLEEFLTAVSTKPVDVPKSLLGVTFHDTTTLVPITQQVLFFSVCRCLDVVSRRFGLFRKTKQGSF
jgi:hypothetical protein